MKKLILTFLLLSISTQAQAQTLDWQYTKDAPNDASPLSGERYEIYGSAAAIATHPGNDTNWFLYLITTNTPPEGNIERPSNVTIGLGDLLIDTNNDGVFNPDYAVRWNPQVLEGSTASLPMGLYEINELDNVGKENQGFSTIQSYYNKIDHRMPSVNSNLYGDIAANEYFDYSKGDNVMKNGTLISNKIILLDDTSPYVSDLDFSSVGIVEGDYTFGFAAKIDLLPKTDFIASIFYECLNDGIAMKVENKGTEIPENSNPLMLVLFMLSSFFAKKLDKST